MISSRHQVSPLSGRQGSCPAPQVVNSWQCSAPSVKSASCRFVGAAVQHFKPNSSWQCSTPGIKSAHCWVVSAAVQLLKFNISWQCSDPRVKSARWRVIDAANRVSAVLLAAEYLKQRKLPGFVASLDFFHAYDRVRLQWVDRVLKEMGFGDKLRGCVVTCHHGAEVSHRLAVMRPRGVLMGLQVE